MSHRQPKKSSPLHKSLQQVMQHISPVLHDLEILRRRVLALSIHDGSLKHVAELRLVAEEVGTHKVHHAPVLHQVVLQRVTCQHHATPVHNKARTQQLPLKMIGETQRSVIKKGERTRYWRRLSMTKHALNSYL